MSTVTTNNIKDLSGAIVIPVSQLSAAVDLASNLAASDSDVVIAGVPAKDLARRYGDRKSLLDYVTTTPVTDWADVFDAAFADPTLTNLYIPPGTYTLLRPVTTVKQSICIAGDRFHGNTRIVGNFADALFVEDTGVLWKNTFANITFENQYNGDAAACLKATFFESVFQGCQFTSKFGKGLWLLGNVYCVTNHIKENYFYGCKYGIYTQPGSTWKSTDAFVIDNYFWEGDGAKVSDVVANIFWEGPSGCTFRGNHPYGRASTAQFHFIGGTYVSLIDNFFEDLPNPRILIQGGNPCSYTITGNKFWGGDGTKLTTEGEQSCLIMLGFNLYNPAVFTFTGNMFQHGTNAVPIFSFRNGDAGIGGIKIEFDRSNVVSGGYSLATKTNGGSASSLVYHRIYSDHTEFFYNNTAQNLAPSSVAGSEFHQYNSGFGEGYHVLPSSTEWCAQNPKIVRNFSTDHTMLFSSGIPIRGTKKHQTYRVAPGESVIIRKDRTVANGYYFEFTNTIPMNGSNANGSFTIFPDGTLHMRHIVEEYAGLNYATNDTIDYAWSYPVESSVNCCVTGTALLSNWSSAVDARRYGTVAVAPSGSNGLRSGANIRVTVGDFISGDTGNTDRKGFVLNAVGKI